MTTRLLITGAAGKLGTFLRPRLARRHRTLRLLDTAPILEPDDAEEVITASITDLVAVAGACRDADAIVHLAGLSDEAPWRELLETNIDGTHNVPEAARCTGIRRVVLASSSHAAGFHRRSGVPLPASVPPRPDTYYGFSKAATEALASLYADRFDMDIATLRIGTCRERPPDVRALATWLSPDDAARLVEACLQAQPFGHRIVWGVSANTRRWWSLAEGEELGYRPTSDAEIFASDVIAAHSQSELVSPTVNLVGGTFAERRLGIVGG